MYDIWFGVCLKCWIDPQNCSLDWESNATSMSLGVTLKNTEYTIW